MIDHVACGERYGDSREQRDHLLGCRIDAAAPRLDEGVSPPKEDRLHEMVPEICEKYTDDGDRLAVSSARNGGQKGNQIQTHEKELTDEVNRAYKKLCARDVPHRDNRKELKQKRQSREGREDPDGSIAHPDAFQHLDEECVCDEKQNEIFKGTFKEIRRARDAVGL